MKIRKGTYKEIANWMKDLTKSSLFLCSKAAEVHIYTYFST